MSKQKMEIKTYLIKPYGDGDIVEEISLDGSDKLIMVLKYDRDTITTEDLMSNYKLLSELNPNVKVLCLQDGIDIEIWEIID